MKKLSLALSLLLTLCLCLPAIAEEPAAQGPVLLAYYTFDDAENLGKDASANANDLIRVINAEGIEAVEGHVGGAVYFHGSSGMTPFDDANNDFIDLNGNTSLTISFWAKVDLEKAHTGNMRVIDHGINGGTDGFTNVLKKNVAEDGTVSGLTFIAVTGGSEWWGAAASVTEDPAGWHHYMHVYDAENCSVTTYVDGVKCGEVYAEEEKLSADFTFCVGGSWAQWSWFNGGNGAVTGEGYIGAVDEVKIIAGAVHDAAAVEAMK